MIAAPSPQQTEYCRIVDGKIVEYPVYDIHIRNRAHPLELYTVVTHMSAPALPEFGYYTKSIALAQDGTPVVSYSVAMKTLAMVLNDIYQKSTGLPLMPGTEPSAVYVKDVSTDQINYITDKASQLAQTALDNWAKQRQYDDIKSLTTYVTSNNPERAAEARRGVDMRDLVWDNLISYITDIKSGLMQIPRSEQEIRDRIPTLTW